MKIVRLTTLLNFGGQEKQYISFTDEPDILEHEYIFAAIGYGGHAEQVLKQRGFQTKIFNLPVAIKNLKNIFILKKWFKEIKPDIVHTAAAEANFHGIIAAKLANVPIIIGEEIGISNHSQKARFIFKQVYKHANKVIGVSKSVSENLIAMNEIDMEKSFTIYNPVSFPREANKYPNENFNWVYVGRLNHIKNVKTLINAFQEIKNPNKGTLHIVGEGDERDELENLVYQPRKIIFHGFQSVPEKIVANSDVFVLPSYSEGFGIAAVEAMFQKVPCLCSNVGGIPEFITNQENGWLFNPYNSNELKEIMEEILSKGKDYASLIGLKAYESVINKFTVKSYVKNLEKFYESL